MKPQPRLQDMPVLIKRRITGHLDFYFDKMSLRSACPNFRPIIGDPKFECERLEFRFFGLEQIELKFLQGPEEHVLKYLQKESGCQVTFKEGFGCCYLDWYPAICNRIGKVIFMEGGSFIDLAISDFEMLFDNPNFSIRFFSLDVESSPFNQHQIGFGSSTFLKKLQPILMKAKLKVENFQMDYEGDQKAVLQVLPHLDSDALKSLTLKVGRIWVHRQQETRVDEIVKLEQLKGVETLSLHGFDVPLELWWNFPKTEIHPMNDANGFGDLKRLLKHFRESPRFQYSDVKTGFKEREIARAFGGDKAGFRLVDEYLYAYLPKTKTKLALHVYIRDGDVEFSRRPQGWREGDDDEEEQQQDEDDDEDEEEEEEDQVDSHLESKQILETLKNKFCALLKMPVMVGMDGEDVKHFEWDNEKKTWKKVDCWKCDQEEQDLGSYSIFEDDSY